MFNLEVIANTYTRNYSAMKGFLDGLSDQESRSNPRLEGNNINWVVGHIVHYRSVILELLEQKSIWNKDFGSIYGFGSPPLPDDKGLSLTDLIAHLDASQDDLLNALASLDDAQLETLLSDGKARLGQRLAFLPGMTAIT